MRIAMIGCGNMGQALAQRLSETTQLYFYDRHQEKAKEFEQKGFGKACVSIKEAIDYSEVIILAFKPQNLQKGAHSIAKELKQEHTIISLLTGTSIETLKQFFSHTKIIRMMPNLAVVYGEGVVGLSADEKILEEEKQYFTKAFEPLGKIYWLNENKMDGLTALTGSGPAFFLTMIEAMIDAGIVMGFTAKDAQELVHQMLQGSLTLLEKGEKHPGELKWQITSPAGTTIAGLKKLEEQALRGNIINTFIAAYEHAYQLSKNWKKE